MSKKQDSTNTERRIDIVRMSPNQYIHVLDTNTNITFLVEGPKNLPLKAHQQLVFEPRTKIRIPPNHHMVIRNPVMRNEAGEIQKEDFGQVKVQISEREVRKNSDYPTPFCLYPGECIETNITQDYIITKDSYILLEVLEDYEVDNKKHICGDKIIIRGPLTFVPRKEQSVQEVGSSYTIAKNQALKLLAERDLIDNDGIKRRAGETWLHRKLGSFIMCSAYIKVVETVSAYILDSDTALELKALSKYTDPLKVVRKAGESWLVTQELASTYILDVHEELISVQTRTTVGDRQYCIILNPVEFNSKHQIVQRYGGKKLIKGPISFFLQPGEEIDGGRPTEIYVLTEEQSLLLFAENEFVDENGVTRRPGERWLFHGTGEYIPPIDATVLEIRNAIPLGEGEGIYIKNENTGEVRAHIGSTYMLKAHESLYEKELDKESEDLFACEKLGIPFIPPRMVNGRLQYVLPDISHYKRDKTRVISYKVSSNRVVQMFNYKTKETKVVFGPSLVLLQPDEILTLLSLSGGNPKYENAIKTFSLMLGPEIMSDTVIVETSDHAQIELYLSYKWNFEYNREDSQNDCNRKLFSTRDFIGDVCKTISSRIRGSVSAITYDDFHHTSAEIIRAAVFGKTKTGEIKESLLFSSNNLIVTACDIKSMKPVEKDIEEKLKKNTFLAINIKTETMKMDFSHKTSMLEQEAKGELDLKKLEDDKQAETERVELFKKIAEKESIISVGQALADAKAECERALIIAENNVKIVEAECQKKKIEADTERELEKHRFKVEEEFARNNANIEIEEAKKQAEIEVQRLKVMIDAVGSENLANLMRAGPDMQADLLKALGLKGYLMTDGKNPINLFDTANGLIQSK